MSTIIETQPHFAGAQLASLGYAPDGRLYTTPFFTLGMDTPPGGLVH
ncbi:MAG: hypothetical protein NTW26_10035 [bacterium]|nr:hypothetical protein [bacterium]